MTDQERDDLIQLMLGALADIAFSEDMTPEGRRAKARRIYEESSRRLGESSSEPGEKE